MLLHFTQTEAWQAVLCFQNKQAGKKKKNLQLYNRFQQKHVTSTVYKIKNCDYCISLRTKRLPLKLL